MLSDLLPLLSSPDPAIRQATIRRIANLRDEAALPHLKRIYESDPDPDLRELALKAGRFIHKSAQAAEKHPYDTDSHDTAPRDNGPELPTAERQTARKFLEAATTFALENAPGRAIDHLGQALAIDPSLHKEPFTANLMRQLTGLSVMEALPVLIHPDRREALIEHVGGRGKLKRTQTHGKGAEKATWDRVAIDFAIYWIASALSILGIIAVVFSALHEIAVDNAANSLSYSNLADQLDAYAAATLAGVLIISLLSATFQTIGLAINGAAIHFAALFVFGGDGTLVYLYRRYVSFQTIVLVLMAAAGTLLAIFDSPAVMLVGLTFGSIAAAVVVAYFMVQIVSEVYNFGMSAGCGALLVAGVILIVMNCAAQWIFSSAIATLLETGS